MRSELFVSKRAALTYCVKLARAVGTPDGVILARSKAKPVYKRGNLLGYIGLYPLPNGLMETVKEGIVS